MSPYDQSDQTVGNPVGHFINYYLSMRKSRACCGGAIPRLVILGSMIN